jgi:hypothetical protein
MANGEVSPTPPHRRTAGIGAVIVAETLRELRDKNRSRDSIQSTDLYHCKTADRLAGIPATGRLVGTPVRRHCLREVSLGTQTPVGERHWLRDDAGEHFHLILCQRNLIEYRQSHVRQLFWFQLV